jgi:glycosyltransferase involved in cell wall biosynthesis
VRVCKIWDGDYPWDVRVEKVARAFTDAGHQVALVARNRARRALRERLPEADVYRLEPWKFLGRKLDDASTFPAFFNPRWLSAISRAVRDSGADVILVRDLPLAPTAIWVGRRFRIPVVLDMAENYPAMLRGRVQMGVQRPTDIIVRNAAAAEMVERWVISRIDHVLVVVEESRDRVVGLGLPHNKVTVVSNTPPLARLQELAPKAHRAGASLELIYLGLLEAPRGIGVLLDAVARARRSGVHATLTILGDGRERKAFEAQAASLSLDSTLVRFLGRVPYDEAVRLLQNADVGVVPHVASEHWNTTIPNKLFDYMAGGLAVLTSNAIPAARVVRESNAGLVFRDTDAGDCAAAIVKLADADFRARSGASGRQAVASRYNWELDSRRMLATVEGLVSTHAGT